MSEEIEKLRSERHRLGRDLYSKQTALSLAEHAEAIARARLSVFDEKHGEKLSLPKALVVVVIADGSEGRVIPISDAE